MPIDKRIATAADALRDTPDGAFVFISGFGGAGFPNVQIRALRECGPRELTLIVNSVAHRFSCTHELIEAGMVCKVICSAARGHGKDLSPFE
jgi:acyl CoA:acetate/3-ketoacid CoA transferase alpha subunit